jgi:hypothetical protein
MSMSPDGTAENGDGNVDHQLPFSRPVRSLQQCFPQHPQR